MSDNKQYGMEEWINHPHVRFSINKNEKEKKADAVLRRFKEKWLFIATLIAIAAAFCVCISFLALKPSSPYAGVALNGVIGLTMALAGYYVRGRSN